MSESETPAPPGNAEAKLLLLIYFAVAGLVLIVFMLDRLPVAAVRTAYALPAVLVVNLVLAIRLLRKGTAQLPAGLGTLGIVFIVGGGLFDMIATVIHTPSLEDESNPIARALLDSGHSVEFVYGYAIVAQTLWLTSISTLWLALLRHRDILIATVHSGRSFMQFFKAATGGAHLTWRQWLVPFNMSELPSAYSVWWVADVVMVSGSIDRWYLGLRWFNLVPSIRSVCLVVAISVGLATYFVWLWVASRLMSNDA